MHIEKFKYYYYINTKLALFVIKTDTQSIYYQTRLRLALEFRVCRDYSQFSIENPSAMCCELSSKNQHARRQQPFTIVLTARKKTRVQRPAGKFVDIAVMVAKHMSLGRI